MQTRPHPIVLDPRAPLAPVGDLTDALGPSLPESKTLPPRAYVADDVFEWELRHFFDAGWVCVGRADDLATPGDQRAVRLGRDAVVLARGDDGRLRGFHNVCRHRGHELLPCGERASGRVIKCPYHAWVYGLDGRLAAAPHFADVPGFSRDDYPLVEARVVEWLGWVYVNASGDAPPFETFIGNLDELVAPWRPAELVASAHREYDVAANWKVITENFHECYHCTSIHPELCKVTPPESGENIPHTGAWVGGAMLLRDFADTMSMDGRSDGVPLPGLTPEQRRRVYYYGLLPNTLLCLHPDYVLTYRLEPRSAGATHVVCEWLLPREATERPGFDPRYAVEFWDVTNREDWRAVESVQRGLASPGARSGPFAWTEDEARLFVQLIARGYLEGRLTPPEAES